MAINILEDVNRDVQAQGWGMNTENTFPLLPNELGEIILPPHCLKILALSNEPNLVQRGNRLYDKSKHTYRLHRKITLDYIALLDFEELPEPFRRYIVIRAARIFQDRVIGSGVLHGFNEQDELRALAALREAENEQYKPNILHHTPGFRELAKR